MNALLILGGTRSGKSRYAQKLALGLSERPVYLATSRVWDADHEQRIRRHQADRGPEWRTIEEPKRLALPELVEQVVVVDCITLWLTNYYVDSGYDLEQSLARAEAELDAALGQNTHWLFVSNEVGQGLHAPSEIGRKFVDLQGFTHQHIASRVAAVCWMVAGIPHYVKGEAPCAV
jgi:adenosylcobinamide kinase / adenosylcobinamide-phosphate guanylyltransferase